MSRIRRVREKPLQIEVQNPPKQKRRRRKDRDVLIEFILDETGSMSSWVNQVVAGYNEYIDGQRELRTKSKCYLSLTKFDASGIKTICEKTDVRFAPRLDHYNYRPGASTNLYDAIGNRLSRLIGEQDLIEDMDVVIVVFTDGYENASREYKYDQVKQLIKRCENLGWTFVYMGANQDAWQVGSTLGVTNVYNTKTFDMSDTIGTFAALNSATAMYRSTRGLENAAVGQAYSFFDPTAVDSNVQAFEPDVVEKKKKLKELPQ